MTLNLRFRYFRRGAYLALTSLIICLCIGVWRYYETDPSLTSCSASDFTWPKQKAVLERDSSLRSTIIRVNDSKIPYQHQVGTLISNGSESTKTDKVNHTTSIGNEMNFIDLDDVKPPINALYNQLTIVTSFSQNHFQEGLGFIGSAQQQMPNKTIIVYDLGLRKETVNKIRSLCNVQLRQFPFENYPDHLKRLHTYAFKPTVINLVLDEFGVVYYGDSSIRFKKSLLEILPDCVAHHGFLGHIRCFDPKVPLKTKYGCYHDYRLTKNELYDKIGVNKTEYYNANFSSPAVSGGLMLLVNSTTIQQKIMKPWLRCALDVTCIAPSGANLGNHRFDQSILSLTVFKNMRGEWNVENDPTPHHNAVVSISRGTNGANWHPQTCD